MRYFMMSQDEDYVTAPKIMNWYQETGIFKWGLEHYQDIGERILLRIEEKENTVFTDFILGPIPLIRNRIKSVMELFEPNLKFITCVLLDRKYGKAEEYHLPLLQEIDCIKKPSKEMNIDEQIAELKGSVKNRCITEYGQGYRMIQPNDLFENIKLVRDNIGDKAIFRIAEFQDNYIIVVRFDLVESILKQHAKGFQLKEINL